MNKYNFTETDKTILKRLVDEKEEEYLSKKRAKDLFEKDILLKADLGTFNSLQAIHKYLFQDCFGTAGLVRKHDIRKGDTLFCKAMYLEDNLKTVSSMKEDTFEDIIEKYVEMNIAHPFREGNGRSMRIWLDVILKKELGQVVDWSKVDKDDYLLAMERSPIRDIEIKHILRKALTQDTTNRELYMKGIDHSYYYEGYSLYRTEDL